MHEVVEMRARRPTVEMAIEARVSEQENVGSLEHDADIVAARRISVIGFLHANSQILDHARNLLREAVQMRGGTGAPSRAGELPQNCARAEPSRVLDSASGVSVRLAAALLNVG